MPCSRVAFVNGGILGLSSYAAYARRAFASRPDIDAEHVVLTEGMTLQERIIRRVFCQRLWPDFHGTANLDFARFRQELHAGIEARRRLAHRGIDRFDVLHFHRQATAYASLDFMQRIPSIVSMDCTQTCALQAVGTPLEAWTIKPNISRDGLVFEHAAAIVATSVWARDDVQRMYPDCKAPIHVMANPVNFEWFDTAWIAERVTYAAEGGRPRVLFVGGDFVRKGGYDLLEAWRVGRFHERATLTLVTDWPVPHLPPGVLIRRGVTAHTRAWADSWRGADVFVMPTRNEAFGLVYQEAAAAGLPVIATRLNAIPEIVDDGKTGVLVPIRDCRALVSAMAGLIESTETRGRMGRAARARVEAAADPAVHTAALVALIEHVRRVGPPPPGRTT